MGSARGILSIVTSLTVLSGSVSVAEETGKRPLTDAIDRSIHRFVTTNPALRRVAGRAPGGWRARGIYAQDRTGRRLPGDGPEQSLTFMQDPGPLAQHAVEGART
jgi:hypothetical protein